MDKAYTVFESCSKSDDCLISKRYLRDQHDSLMSALHHSVYYVYVYFGLPGAGYPVYERRSEILLVIPSQNGLDHPLLIRCVLGYLSSKEPARSVIIPVDNERITVGGFGIYTDKSVFLKGLYH